MINFVLGPNGVGKSLFFKKMEKKGAILLEVNQKIEDLTSDSKENSFLIKILNKIHEEKMKNINSLKNCEFAKTKTSISYMSSSKTKEITFGKKDFSIKDITDSSAFKKESAGEQAIIALNLIRDNTISFKGVNILIDEVDAFLHPSAFIEAVNSIKEISKKKIDVWVVTHNPKILSKFEIFSKELRELISIYYFKEYMEPNDRYKNISNYKLDYNIFTQEINDLSAQFKKDINCYKENNQTMINLLKNIKNDDSLKAAFLNLQFKNVWSNILVEKELTLFEGPTEVLFFQDNPEDIKNIPIPTFGKWWMSFSARLCQKLEIDFKIIFDKDDESNNFHKEINKYLGSFVNFTELDPNLEKEYSIKPINGKKSSNKELAVLFHIINKNNSNAI